MNSEVWTRTLFSIRPIGVFRILGNDTKEKNNKIKYQTYCLYNWFLGHVDITIQKEYMYSTNE